MAKRTYSACFSSLILMSSSHNTEKFRKYDQSLQHLNHYVPIFVMFLYCCYPLESYHSIQGKADPVKHLLIEVICTSYSTVNNKLPIHPQTRFLISELLQYSSSTNLEQNFTKYPTYLDPLVNILHIMVKTFFLNHCREKSYPLNVCVQ